MVIVFKFIASVIRLTLHYYFVGRMLRTLRTHWVVLISSLKQWSSFVMDVNLVCISYMDSPSFLKKVSYLFVSISTLDSLNLTVSLMDCLKTVPDLLGRFTGRDPVVFIRTNTTNQQLLCVIIILILFHVCIIIFLHYLGKLWSHITNFYFPYRKKRAIINDIP